MYFGKITEPLAKISLLSQSLLSISLSLSLIKMGSGYVLCGPGCILFPNRRLSLCFNIISPNNNININNKTTRNPFVLSASKSSSNNPINKDNKNKKEEIIKEDIIEEEVGWIEDKAMDLVEFTGSVTSAIPGPRVSKTQVPWALAVPLAYIGFTFAFSLFKTFQKFTSPKHARRKLVNKNAVLCKSIDELFEKGTYGIHQAALTELVQKTGFSMSDIVRKYIRYALNEKSFDTNLVVNLIQLRKASSLDDSDVAEIINDISRRIVKDKGPVVMVKSGYSEKGLMRKVAVQALFGKIYYLSELPEFCARDNSYVVKEIFGVTDEDAEEIRLHTISQDGDLDSLEKLIGNSESRDSSDDSTTSP